MKILLIGPLPPPVTGNSIVNEKIVKDFSKYYNSIHMDFINVGVASFDNDFGKFNIKKFILYFSQYKTIYKVFFTDTIYVSIGHTFFGVLKYLPFFVTAKLFRKSIITHVHTDYLWSLYEQSSTAKRKILKTILGMVDKGIVLSPILRRNLKPFIGEDKIYELPNFISDSLLEHDINETIRNKKDKKLKILFLSNLIKEKGIIDFLKAMAILQKKALNFEVHIAGDIPSSMRMELELYFAKLENCLHYHGIVKGDEKKALFLSSHIFVFPTYTEAQPLVLLEAMATANLIVSTHVGGIPDIFKDQRNGFTVNVGDPENIANKVIEIQNGLTLYDDMLKSNYREVKSKYTDEIFFKNLYKIIMD